MFCSLVLSSFLSYCTYVRTLTYLLTYTPYSNGHFLGKSGLAGCRLNFLPPVSSDSEPLEITGIDRFFTGRTSFLLPREQCQQHWRELKALKITHWAYLFWSIKWIPRERTLHSLYTCTSTTIDWVVVLHPTRHKIGHFGDVPQANLWHGMKKQNLTQQKHTFTNQKKCTTQNRHTYLKPSLVASCDTWPGNGEGLCWFWRFINLSLTYLLRHLPTHMGQGTSDRKDAAAFLYSCCLTRKYGWFHCRTRDYSTDMRPMWMQSL